MMERGVEKSKTMVNITRKVSSFNFKDAGWGLGFENLGSNVHRDVEIGDDELRFDAWRMAEIS